MIKGIGHAGIIVKNLDEAVDLYCDLFGLEKPSEVVERADEGMKHALINFGEQFFEVMEPFPGSSLAKFLEQHGEGLHHINLMVSDMEPLVKSLKEKGAILIERGPKFAFVHPKSTRGVLFELMEQE